MNTPAQSIDAARSSLQQNHYGQALERIDKVLVDTPGDPDARFLRGMALTGLGRREEAISLFRQMTEDFPQLPEPFNNLAALYAQDQQYRQARLALESAIRLRPGYALAHSNLGDVLIHEALNAYRDAEKDGTMNSHAVRRAAQLQRLLDEPGTEPVTRLQPAAITAPPSVLPTLESWAAAWSHHDLATYLAHYAPDFVPPAGLSREAWTAQRRHRLETPGPITVTFEDVKVTPVGQGEDRLRARFRQHYRSRRGHESTLKELTLAFRSGRWLIIQEFTPR